MNYINIFYLAGGYILGVAITVLVCAYTFILEKWSQRNDKN